MSISACCWAIIKLRRKSSASWCGNRSWAFNDKIILCKVISKIQLIGKSHSNLLHFYAHTITTSGPLWIMFATITTYHGSNETNNTYIVGIWLLTHFLWYVFCVECALAARNDFWWTSFFSNVGVVSSAVRIGFDFTKCRPCMTVYLQVRLVINCFFLWPFIWFWFLVF